MDTHRSENKKYNWYTKIRTHRSENKKYNWYTKILIHPGLKIKNITGIQRYRHTQV